MGLRSDLEMSEDLSKLIDQVANMKRMSRERVIETFKQIVLSRAKSELGLDGALKVTVNEQKGEVEISSIKHVVEVVKNESSQIGFLEAIRIDPNAKLGGDLLLKVQPHQVKSLLPGALRELWTGISNEGRESKTGMGNGEEIDEHDVAKTHRTQALLHLPELPERVTPVSAPIERSEELTDTEELEGDTPDLLRILVNDPSSTDRIERGEKSFPVSDNEPESNTEDILTEIERVLRDRGYLQVRRNLNELEVDVTKCNNPFTTIFHIYNGIVNARSWLPFVIGVSVDLLTLCGQADFMSSVGLVLQRNKPCYVIKNVYPVKALSRKTLGEMVSQAILDASKANEIINSRKPVGK